MALFRLEMKLIGRARGENGQSAVAAAAYRSGQPLKRSAPGAAAYQSGQRLGEADYSRKRHILHTEIMAPAYAPDWLRDREMLWNDVERVENRKNSRFAREIIVSLQRELSFDQNLELLRAFVATEFVARGLVADLAIHDTKASDGGQNPHAHVMVTTRPVNPFGWEKKKDRALNGKDQLIRLRGAWAEAVNDALADAAASARVDHRSLEARGIDRIPQPKLGPAAAAQERKGKPTRRGDQRRRAAYHNTILAFAQPQSVASAEEEALRLARLHGYLHHEKQGPE